MTTPEAAPWAPPGRPDLHAFVPRRRRVAPLMVWLGCLVAALVLLVWLGDGRLAAPDLTQPSSWGAWADERGTATVVVSGLRVLALGLAWYLVGVTSVSMLAHAARAARLVRLADALSFGPVRSVVQQALGVGLAVGVVASALPQGALGGVDVSAAATPVATATVAAVPLDDAAAGDDVPGRVDDDPKAETGGERTGTRRTDAATGRRAGAVPPVPGPRLVATPLADATTDDVPDTPAARVDVADEGHGDPATGAGDTTGAADGGHARNGREVRVRPGDHLWGIAEADLRDTVGRQPSEAEVLVHWERVVAANADRLVVPSNPDLLRPGQLVVLPDVEVPS